MTADRTRAPAVVAAPNRIDAPDSPDVITQHFARLDMADFSPALTAGADATAGGAAIYGQPLPLLPYIPAGSSTSDVHVIETDGVITVDSTVISTAEASLKHTPSGTFGVHTMTFAESAVPAGAEFLLISGNIQQHLVSDVVQFSMTMNFFDSTHSIVVPSTYTDDASVQGERAWMQINALRSDTWFPFQVIFQVPQGLDVQSFQLNVSGRKPTTLLAVAEVSYYNDFAVSFPTTFKGVTQGFINPTLGIQNLTLAAGTGFTGSFSNSVTGSFEALDQAHGILPSPYPSRVSTTVIVTARASNTTAVINVMRMRVDISFDGGVSYVNGTEAGFATVGLAAGGSNFITITAQGRRDGIPSGPIVMRLMFQTDAGVVANYVWSNISWQALVVPMVQAL